MSAPRMAATRVNLLRGRHQLAQVHKGAALLKRKREALGRELFRLARPAADLRARIAAGFAEGYTSVLHALATQGRSGLRAIAWPERDVVVRMEPASGFDLNTGEGQLVYKGPKRLPVTGVVKEAVRTGDFEAVLSWAIGLDGKVPFRVSTASSPSRLIVDFRNT